MLSLDSLGRDVFVGADDHAIVGGLDVAVNDAVPVGVFQSLQCLHGVSAGLVIGQAPPFAKHFGQCGAVDVFHGHVVFGRGLKVIVKVRGLGGGAVGVGAVF